MYSVFVNSIQILCFSQESTHRCKICHGQGRCDKPGTCVAMREHKMAMSIITKGQ